MIQDKLGTMQIDYLDGHRVVLGCYEDMVIEKIMHPNGLSSTREYKCIFPPEKVFAHLASCHLLYRRLENIIYEASK